MADNSRTGKRKQGGKGKPFAEGTSGNPGGRRKSIQAIEQMLDAEHRTPERLRPVYKRLRRVAMGVKRAKFYKGQVIGYERVYDAAFMEIYLNRVQGPVQQIKADLSDAPDEVVAWLAEHLN